ncbi:hypothetical protein ScPMuIL_015061 [Solemya velum]
MPGLSGFPDIERGHARNGPYSVNGYDPYRRDDFYRDEDLPRRDIVREEALGRSYRNGYGSHVDYIERSSLDERIGEMKQELVFEVDHLATYTASGRSGPMVPEDGLRKLRQMENTTGIWTMRCVMVIDHKHVVIQDKATGEELERFPVDMVHEPTAILKNDRREIYNNLVLFSIMDDPRKRGSADMHIFQSISSPAQDIVDEILSVKESQSRVVSHGHRSERSVPLPTHPVEPRYHEDRAQYVKHIVREPPASRDYVLEREYVRTRTPSPPRRDHIPIKDLPPDRDFIVSRGGGGYLVEDNHRSKAIGQSQRPMGFRASYFREREDLDTGQNEALERDVQLLNNCFDDIEKFVARLQQAAEAYKELERRKKDHNGRNHKKRPLGEGMLTLRSKPPPSEDFIDIFQKFKYAFCILSKLKAHIHDPNAPELVHFLFTPLSLIYEASRDPVHRGIDLADKAISPMLTPEAKQLLLNCLTSKELELWQALGKNWTISRDEYRGGQVPVYSPRFYDGWQPSPMTEERDSPNFNVAAMAHASQIERRAQEERARERAAERIVPFPPTDEYRVPPPKDDYQYSQVQRREPRPPSPPPGAFNSGPGVAGYQEYVEKHIERNKNAHKVHDDPLPLSPMSHNDENTQFIRELKRMGATINEVKFERAGRNAKELSVEKGDILQVIDSSRNWWKVKNARGQVGYVPYTLLKDLEEEHYDKESGEHRLSGSYSSYLPDNYPPSAPPVPDSSPRREEKNPGRWAAPERHDQGNIIVAPGPPALPARGTDVPPKQLDRIRHANSPGGSPRLHHQKKHFNNPEQSRHHDELRNELRNKVNSGTVGSDNTQNLNRYAGAVYLTKHSGAQGVQEWLEAKGFSPYCLQTMEGYNGQELFDMQRREMERLLDREEAHRLDSQLTVQKNISGYGTRGASELNAILRKRKEHADSSTKQPELGHPPNFSPGPPDYSTDDSDGCSDDFADAGKTLRDLLLRQRHRLQSVDFQ